MRAVSYRIPSIIISTSIGLVGCSASRSELAADGWQHSDARAAYSITPTGSVISADSIPRANPTTQAGRGNHDSQSDVNRGQRLSSPSTLDGGTPSELLTPVRYQQSADSTAKPKDNDSSAQFRDKKAESPTDNTQSSVSRVPNGLSLDQVINATLLADPKLLAGFEAINQASGDALTASLKPNPTFGIVQSLLPLTVPFTEDRQGGPPQLDIGLAYPIDWFVFGKRAAAMQAATLGVRVSEAEFADLIRQRVLAAATAYYDVLEAQSLLELARQDAENLRRVEEITRRAVEGGGLPQVELGRVRLDRLRADQGVRDAENSLVAAKAALRALMGLADADPNFELSGSLEVISTPELPSVEEAYQLARQNRPDIAALQWRVHQAQADFKSELRRAYPEMISRIGYTHQFQRKAIGFPDADSYGFGLEMTLPINNRNQGNRLKAASVVTQQNYGLQAGLVQLRAEVIQADQELRTVQANAKAVAEEQLKLAAEVRDSLNKAYEAGGRPLIDVLDAQRNYRDTYRLYIGSRANLGRASVRYSATLGRQLTP